MLRYSEQFDKSHVLMDNVNYVINQVKLAHDFSHNWYVSEPTIRDNGDGTASLSFQLEKYDTQEEVQARYDKDMEEKRNNNGYSM